LSDKNDNRTQPLRIGVEGTLCEFYLLEFYQVLRVNIRKKICCDSGREKEKETTLKHIKVFCSSKQGLPSGENS